MLGVVFKPWEPSFIDEAEAKIGNFGGLNASFEKLYGEVLFLRFDFPS